MVRVLEQMTLSCEELPHTLYLLKYIALYISDALESASVGDRLGGQSRSCSSGHVASTSDPSSGGMSDRMCASETSTPVLSNMRKGPPQPIIMNQAQRDSNEDNEAGNVNRSANDSTFEEVSEDMSQLVQHLNSIHNDISQLAKKNNLVMYSDSITHSNGSLNNAGT